MKQEIHFNQTGTDDLRQMTLADITFDRDDFDVSVDTSENEYGEYVSTNVAITPKKDIDLSVAINLMNTSVSKFEMLDEKWFAGYNTQLTNVKLLRVRKEVTKMCRWEDARIAAKAKADKFIEGAIENHIVYLNRAMKNQYKKINKEIVEWIGAWKNYDFDEPEYSADTATLFGLDSELKELKFQMSGLNKTIKDIRNQMVKRSLDGEHKVLVDSVMEYTNTSNVNSPSFNGRMRI